MNVFQPDDGVPASDGDPDGVGLVLPSVWLGAEVPPGWAGIRPQDVSSRTSPRAAPAVARTLASRAVPGSPAGFLTWLLTGRPQ